MSKSVNMPHSNSIILIWGCVKSWSYFFGLRKQQWPLGKLEVCEVVAGLYSLQDGVVEVAVTSKGTHNWKLGNKISSFGFGVEILACDCLYQSPGNRINSL